MLVVNVDEHCLIITIFSAKIGVGVMKYYMAGTIKQVAEALAIARGRNPEGGLDLSMLNVADTQSVFRKREEN
jgi:stage V sporulation protein SpoVS